MPGNFLLELISIDGVFDGIIKYLDVMTVAEFVPMLLTNGSFRKSLSSSSIWEEACVFFFGCDDPNHDLLPKQTGLAKFLQGLREVQQFQSSFHILRGDISKVKEINGQPIDGIAFPTNRHLRNLGWGCASAVFQIAGNQELGAFVSEHIAHNGLTSTGDIIVTPGFNSGVPYLFHCIGPYRSMRRKNMWLYRTYRNLFTNIQQQQVHNVVIGSIATGSLRFSKFVAAEIAAQAYRDFRRVEQWEGNVGIVCYEEDVFSNFLAEKNKSIVNINRAHNFDESDD